MTTPNPEVQKLAREMLDGLEGVTPGPWQTDPRKSPGEKSPLFPCHVTAVYDDLIVCKTDALHDYPNLRRPSTQKKNAAHIARCSPENIALLCRAILEKST